MKRSTLLLALSLSVMAPVASAHAARHMTSAKLPNQLRSRISLARQLSHGNVKSSKTMGASETMLLLKRKQFEGAVLKLVSSARVDPGSKRPEISRRGLCNVQRLYDELPAAFRATIKGRPIPLFSKRTSKLTSVQRSVLRSSVDRWMAELGLKNMSWILRHNDKTQVLRTISLDRRSGDIAQGEMNSFRAYWGLKGMWQ
jgi:hypothetical protein